MYESPRWMRFASIRLMRIAAVVCCAVASVQAATPNQSVAQAGAEAGTASSPAATSRVLQPALRVRQTPVEFQGTELSRALTLRLQPLDTIKLQVWGYPDLDHTAVVQPNGMITVPLLGEIPASGETLVELRKAITEGLEQYARSPVTELRTADTLTMDVWQHPDMRTIATIDPGGSVMFPLVGSVAAAGRDLEDIRAEVEQRLLHYVSDARVTLLPRYNNRRVIYDPKVSVLTEKLEPRRVALIGEVGVPGFVEIRGSLRLVEALAQAHVQDTTGKMNGIIVIRDADSGPQFKTLRIADYLAGNAPDENIYLQPRDIVIVPKTLITKVGEFVEQFISRTAPVFSWWVGLNQATVAMDSSRTVKILNKALEDQLVKIKVGPN